MKIKNNNPPNYDAKQPILPENFIFGKDHFSCSAYTSIEDFDFG